MTVRGLAGSDALRAFRHRNFRLFFAGQAISLVGSWMQSVAQAWLVLTLTNDPLILGVVAAAQWTPVLFLGLFGGLIADALPKRPTLVVVELLMGVLAVVLGVLSFAGVVQVWMVLVLAVLLGCLNAVEMPVRQAFAVEMVGREYIMNAVALNSATLTMAPASSGLRSPASPSAAYRPLDRLPPDGPATRRGSWPSSSCVTRACPPAVEPAPRIGAGRLHQRRGRGCRSAGDADRPAPRRGGRPRLDPGLDLQVTIPPFARDPSAATPPDCRLPHEATVGLDDGRAQPGDPPPAQPRAIAFGANTLGLGLGARALLPAADSVALPALAGAGAGRDPG